jgi:hypothetical protein
MSTTQKSVLWVLVGFVVGLVALGILGGQALAEESTPLTKGIYSSANMGSAHYDLDWNVVGTGGGTISSPQFTVSSTIGQPTIGSMTSSHFEVYTGYWCWFDYIASVFLPILFMG